MTLRLYWMDMKWMCGGYGCGYECRMDACFAIIISVSLYLFDSTLMCCLLINFIIAFFCCYFWTFIVFPIWLWPIVGVGQFFERFIELAFEWFGWKNITIYSIEEFAEKETRGILCNNVYFNPKLLGPSIRNHQSQKSCIVAYMFDPCKHGSK